MSTGPHNTQLHRVVDVAAAYRSAVSELSYALSSGLLNRRDMLFAQLHRLAHRMDEITYVRGVIEKDVKGEFGGILDRLRGAEGKKVAVLQNQMAGLQADVEKIDHLFHEYDQVKGDKIEFLLRSRSVREDVEGLLLKVFRTDIDQTPYDLPRELKELRAKLERKAVGTQLLKLKDEVIWRLFTEKKDREEKAIENYNTQVSTENSSWQNFIDKHTQELKRYELVCFFCADVLGGTTVNKRCKVNENKSISPNFQGFTVSSPERDYIGNGKHFFARPKPDLFGSNQAFDNLQQLFTDQQTEVIKKKTMWEIGANLLLVKKAARERNINVEAMLKAHDKSDLGMMSKPKFTYLLHEKLGIGQDKVNCFMMLLDPQHKGMVNYREFMTMMNKPELLDNEMAVGDQMVSKGILGLVADAAEGMSVDHSSKLQITQTLTFTVGKAPDMVTKVFHHLSPSCAKHPTPVETNRREGCP